MFVQEAGVRFCLFSLNYAPLGILTRRNERIRTDIGVSIPHRILGSKVLPGTSCRTHDFICRQRCVSLASSAILRISSNGCWLGSKRCCQIGSVLIILLRTLIRNRALVFIVFSRVADPDPNWIRI